MLEEQSNIPDLPSDKLRLEIEELKLKIEEQKKGKIWDNYIKPLIPVAVTLTIGIWGSILTSSYNSSQLENAKRKNSADSSVAQTQLRIAQTQLDIANNKNKSEKELAETQLEISKRKNETDRQTALTQLTISKHKNESDKTIAQINASLGFVKLLQDISNSNPDLTHQAKTVIAPALPPEISFNIAVTELTSNPNALEVLLRTYENDSWKYLSPYSEYTPKYLSNNTTTETKPLLFEFLSKRLLLDKYYEFLVSADYKTSNRIYSLINYFDFIYDKEELPHNVSKVIELRYSIAATIDKTTSNLLKSDLAGAASIVFDKYGTDQIYSDLAAKYYWKKYNLSIGQTPFENSADQYIYENRIARNKQEEVASNSLFSELIKLNFESFTVDRLGIICYSYSQSTPKGTNEVFGAYLQPEQSYQLVSRILTALNTPARRKEFARHLGSLSGLILFKKISQNKIIGKRYVELIITWYKLNWRSDWYIPSFFSYIIKEYPDLKSEVDRKWGVQLD